jgi:hypothetical protein
MATGTKDAAMATNPTTSASVTSDKTLLSCPQRRGVEQSGSSPGS